MGMTDGEFSPQQIGSMPSNQGSLFIGFRGFFMKDVVNIIKLLKAGLFQDICGLPTKSVTEEISNRRNQAHQNDAVDHHKKLGWRSP